MRSLGIVLLMLAQTSAFPQWESVAGGYLYGNASNVFYDTIDGRIYLVGNMRYMTQDSLEVRATTYWKDGTWHKLGYGSTYSGIGVGPAAQAIIRYDTTIVVVGQLRMMDSVPDTKGVAQWYGGEWHSMGIDSSLFYSANPYALAVIDDTLHMMGAYSFGYNGDTIRSWATWDGALWRKGDPGEELYAVGAACKYLGHLYIGGNFTTSAGIKDLAKRGPNGWEQLGPGLLGDPWVNDMIEYDGLLWVVGEFYQSAGNIGSGIMAWDGTQWLNPFPQIAATSQGRSLDVHDGRLYFTMQMLVQGLAGEYMLGAYDGDQLCILGGPDVFLVHVAAGPDTVYAQTCEYLFCAGNGPLVNGIVKWPLDAPADACFDVDVGLQEQGFTQAPLRVWPNPVLDALHLNNASSAQATITDATGRQVMAASVPAHGTLPVGALASGCYMLHLRDAQQRMLGVVRFAKE